MKRFLINTVLLVTLVASLGSCKKKIEEDYANPELASSGSLSKLLTGMFLNPRIHPSYYDFATFIIPTTAGFSQLVAMPPSTQMYIPSINYNQTRWEHYYDGSMPSDKSAIDYNYNGPGILSTYREMQTSYAALSAEEQAKQLVFLQCAKVVLYDQTAQVIDLWGDIPFTKAGSLNTAARSLSDAPFDKAEAIYDTLINGLKDLNTYFASANLATETQATLSKQDILLGGDITKWRRYANSLRLRLLMRTSYFNEARAKTEVSAMLADPSTYPVISDNSYNVLLNESPTTLKSDILDAFGGAATPTYAPSFLLDTLMVANADPRTAVLFDSVANKPYKGFPYNGTTSQYEAGGFATYDSATFLYNYNIPGVLFTAAEVSFLTAEANERWGAGSTPAATAYANGIRQSVAFYYGINQTKILRSGSWASLPSPSAAAVDAYISNVAYTGTTTQKLAKIATQNWINFFVLQSGQGWAEYRRTKLPALRFATATSGEAQQPPTRLLYPSSEQLYNATNYAAVASKDTRTTKIFWDVK